MAVFQSRYRELSFKVGEETFHFKDGKFTTDDSKVIAVMETMRNVKRIDEPKKAEVAEEASKTEEKSVTKRTTTRKASAK